jgi:hypothetical protein
MVMVDHTVAAPEQGLGKCVGFARCSKPSHTGCGPEPEHEGPRRPAQHARPRQSANDKVCGSTEEDATPLSHSHGCHHQGNRTTSRQGYHAGYVLEGEGIEAPTILILDELSSASALVSSQRAQNRS